MLGDAKLGYLMLGRYLMQSVRSNKKEKTRNPGRPTYQVTLSGVLVHVLLASSSLSNISTVG
jgi:hypothetical protein